MQQFHDRFAADSRVDAQQLHHHLGELRKSVNRTYAMCVDFELLTQEAQLDIAAAQALLQDINLLADKLGVSRLPFVKLQAMY